MATWIFCRRIVFAALLFAGLSGLCCASAPCAPAPQNPATASAREPWQQEFDHVCSNTQEAMSFSEEELASLIRRCDALQPRIEKLDETRRKVYLGRLKMCRGLYAYVLESKRNERK
jgi:hypothetical protein